MPRVGFEPTIPSFTRAKTGHALNRAASVIGNATFTLLKYVLKLNPVIKRWSDRKWRLVTFFTRICPSILPPFRWIFP
jgi:hypothetical protein